MPNHSQRDQYAGVPSNDLRIVYSENFCEICLVSDSIEVKICAHEAVPDINGRAAAIVRESELGTGQTLNSGLISRSREYERIGRSRWE